MHIQEFAELVEEMRKAQKAFFSSRQAPQRTEALREAKAAEAKVDAAIKEVLEVK